LALKCLFRKASIFGCFVLGTIGTEAEEEAKGTIEDENDDDDDEETDLS
jgi:hypothetical protein